MSGGLPATLQRHWDLRAATNFVLGGAGSGLIVASAFAGTRGVAGALELAAGFALVGAGLTSVWFEIGRPWRALNVFRNPRTSWMSREAWAAVALGAAVAVAATLRALGVAGETPASFAAAVLAVAFAYSQGRMLQAAKGVPAWRSPVVPALILVTALAEGAGAWWIVAALRGSGTLAGLTALGGLVVVRMIVWLAYRRTIAQHPRAPGALDTAAEGLFYVGTLAPLALVVWAGATTAAGTVSFAAALAGALALAGGAWAKVAIVVRAAYLQAFALPRWPVRGTRGDRP